MFIHIRDRGLVINMNRYDTLEIVKNTDGTVDLAAIRYDGQLKIGTLIDRFENEQGALALQQQIVEKLAFSDHVLGIQRDFVGQLNNLGKSQVK